MKGCENGGRVEDIAYGRRTCCREADDFDTDRGKICPMAMHVAFVYADILRYGGTMPRMKDGAITFCCPDADVINIFEIRKES